jgi:hypothetical protein
MGESRGESSRIRARHTVEPFWSAMRQSPGQRTRPHFRPRSVRRSPWPDSRPSGGGRNCPRPHHFPTRACYR